ncbi:MAG: hypothetical protein WCP86_05965 [bacterium]
MHAPYSPLAVATLVALVNLPFGYWRASCRKFSVSWFASVHLPVILAIALRISLGIAFVLSTVSMFILAFISGQFVGGWIQRQTRTQH